MRGRQPGHPVRCDERWNNDELAKLSLVKGSDIEAVDVSSLMVHPDSGQARQTRIPGDINSDGHVNIGDLQLLVAAWGSGPGYSGAADVNQDGLVNVADLQHLVANWGNG